MTTLGGLLKKEREEMGFSVEKAANALRVRQEYLLNVESDNYKQLPPDVYISGFLKSYARLLNLDEKQVVNVYRHQEKVEKKNVKNTKEKRLQKKRSIHKLPRIIMTPEIIFSGILMLVVVVITAYFLRAAGNFSLPPTLEITSPKENETVKEERLKIIGKVSNNSDLEINGQKITLGEGGKFETELILMEGMNEIRIKAQNKFEKSLEKRITVNYEASLLKGKRKKIVSLKTDSEPVWISVESLSNTFSETLSANSQKAIELSEETKIIVEKGNGVYFTENGGALEIFGESADKAERIFSP